MLTGRGSLAVDLADLLRCGGAAEVSMDASGALAEQQLRRLRPFVSPHVWELIASAREEELLESSQREIVVAFCDLRGFTAFVHTATPAVLVEVLADYHRGVGPVILQHHGILERFIGDGLMVYFDDASLAVQARCAVRMAVQIRDLVADLAAGWRRWGHQLDVGIGIALGPAVPGRSASTSGVTTRRSAP